MKFIISLFAVLLSAQLFAAGDAVVTGSNICGVLKVTSSYKNTFVSVPWQAIGSGGDIQVEKLVMTANLTTNDSLYVYSDSKWYKFDLTESDGKKSWIPATTVSEGDAVSETTTALTLSAGTSFILTRADTSKPFYLYGQKPDTTPTSTAPAGTAETPTFTLIASPKTEALKLISIAGVGNKGDEIRSALNTDGTSVIYKKGDTSWQKLKKGDDNLMTWTDVEESDAIPMGNGFWYINKGAEVTFNWASLNLVNLPR